MSIQLIHYQSPQGNVGDDFSPWLFSKLLGPALRDDGKAQLFGVGSILTTSFVETASLPNARKIVFGSGTRAPDAAPDTHGTDWKVYCVRGPLTATALGLPADKAVADPGILGPRFFSAKPAATRTVGIVPYFTASEALWGQVARRHGWHVVSPRQSFDTFVEALMRCDRVYCESMHGAIFADAYRIPWRAISGSSLSGEGTTHAFKWTDWCSAMGLGFDSLKIPGLHERSQSTLAGSLKDRVKVEMVSRQLAANSTFTLSQDHVLAARQDQLLELAEQLRTEADSSV